MKNKLPTILRYVIFAAEILLLWLAQSTPKLLPLAGFKPFLLLAAALSFACCVQVAPAVILGAVCGALADISSGGTVGFFAVAFTLLCFAQASLLGTYLNHNVLTAAVLSAGSAVAVLGLHFLLFRAFSGAPDSGLLLAMRYLPCLAGTLAAFFPLYALNRLLTNKLSAPNTHY